MRETSAMRAARRLLPVIIVLSSTPFLPAHKVSRGIGSAIVVAVREDRVLLTFDLGFSDLWGQTEMVSMDSSRDGGVDEDEAEAYMRRAWEERVFPYLDLRVDGVKLALKKVSSREDNLRGEIAPTPFDIYYELEAELPPGTMAPGKEHVLELENHTLKRESPIDPTFYVPMDPEAHARGLSFRIVEPPQLIDIIGFVEHYTMLGRKLVMKFELGEVADAAAGEPAASGPAPASLPRDPSPAAPRARVAEDPRQPEDQFFAESFRNYRTLGLWGKLLLILLAMFYGAGHALGPGHGKTMVAAYLVGSRGRIRDAVVLGLATTFTHTITVFLAGIGIYLAVHYGAEASQEAMKNRILVATSIISGLLLFILGVSLFLRRWRFAGDPEALVHDHEHHHGPGGHHHGLAGHHHHAPPPGTRLTFWSLVGLGASGGLVPCPAGIFVILLGLHYKDPGALLFSLLLLVFFSVALGAVLVAIGIFVVTGRKLFEGRVKVSPVALSYLPALSALFIAGLGTYFTVVSFQGGRTEVAAMLEGLAEILRG